MLGPAAISAPPRRLRRRGDQGRGARGRLRAPDDVADRPRRARVDLADAPAPQPGQEVARARPQGARGRAGVRGAGARSRRRDRGDAARVPRQASASASTGCKELNPRDRHVHDLRATAPPGPYREPAEPRHRLRHVGRAVVQPVVDDDGFCRIPDQANIGITAGPAFGAMAILAALVRARTTGERRVHGDRPVATPRRTSTGTASRRGRATTSDPTTRSPATRSDDYERRAAGPRRHVGGRALPVLRVVRRPRAVHGVASRCSGRTSARASAGWTCSSGGRARSTPTTPAATASSRPTCATSSGPARRGEWLDVRRRAQHHDRPGEHAADRRRRPAVPGPLHVDPEGGRRRRRSCCSRCTSTARSCRCRRRRRRSASTPTRCSGASSAYDDERLAKIRETGALG